MAFPLSPTLNHLAEITESLNDRLIEASSLPAALTAGLRFLLEQTGRPGGGIYVPPQAGRSGLWIGQCTPESWSSPLDDPGGSLKSLADEVIQTRALARGAEADQPGARPIITLPQLAAALPISYRDDVTAVLFLSGTPAFPEELTTWATLLRPLGRGIHLLCSRDSDTGQKKSLDVLKVVAATLDTSLHAHQAALGYVSAIQRIFEADAVILSLLDDENEEIAHKKVLHQPPDWELETSFKLGNGVISQCLRSGHSIYIPRLADSRLYNADLDGSPNLDPQALACIPLQSNGEMLGCLELLHNRPESLTPYDLDLLTVMANSLANVLFSLRLVQRLKLANADLEVNRWELLHSRNTLRSLFDSMPASIYIIDNRYNLVAINKSRATRANAHPASLVGKMCYEKLHGRSDPCPGCRVQETLASARTTYRTDRELVNSDQMVEWDISTFPILEEDSLPTQVIVLEQDVTDKRRLEANLIQSEKLAAVGQLAAGVAHEINNPLSAVIANAQLLSMDIPADNADLQESVHLIEQAGLRASQVVRNLLSISRKEQYELNELDLNESIQMALTLLQHEFIARPIKLNLDLQPDLPKLKASRDHLQGVWMNMVMNALDSMDGDRGELSITSRFLLNEFRVMIHDSGKGIPKEQLSRIFEPFFTTKSVGRGTGLGLSLCHRTIKQHGGYIQVDSEMGVGTTFTVVLPASPG